MKQILKNHWYIYRRDILQILWFLLGGFLFGQIAMALVALFSTSAEPWFPAGTMFAMLGAFMLSMIYDGYNSSSRYQLAFAMGRARKPQILVQMLFTLLRLVISLVLAYLLALLEEQICLRFYAGRFMELSPRVFFTFPIPLVYIFVPFLIVTLVSSILCRFGPKSGIVLYLIFMVSALTVPRIIDRIESNPSGAAHQFFLRMFSLIADSPAVLILPALLIAAIVLFASCRMLMTMSVRFP